MASINLDKKLICQKLSEGDMKFVIKLLETEFKLFVDETSQNKTTKLPTEQSYDILEYLLKIIQQCVPQLEDNDILLANQCFKSLRNCVIHAEVEYEFSESTILDNTFEIMKYLLEDKRDISKSCLKMLLQCLCNTILIHKGLNYDCWDKYVPYFSKMLKEEKSLTEAIMLMNNIFSFFDSLIPNDITFLQDLLYVSDVDEHIEFILEKMVTCDVITNLYEELTSAEKIKIFESLIYMAENEIGYIPEELINLMSKHFQEKSKLILTTAQEYKDDIEPVAMCQLLDCLGNLSANDRVKENIQSNSELLDACITLLKTIQLCGKTSNNSFTPIDKIDELKNQSDLVKSHPAFGFKSNLIRLIGNMAESNEANQNKIRELDAIPLLLDCCNIDARNPLIIQWVTLAMRNLCKGNTKNQDVIAQMTKVGVVDSSSLKEMGLVLSDSGEEKIVLMPYDKV